MKKYFIRFPIGDWSDDGHGKCHYYTVYSNMPVEEIREIHFSAIEKLGFSIGDICSNYEDSELSLEIIEKLQKAGFDMEWEGKLGGDRYYSTINERCMDIENIFHLWVDILIYINPKLEFEMAVPEDINFYGFDDKKRHLETPGYGAFY